MTHIMWLQLETGTPNLAIVSSHTYKLTHGRLVHPKSKEIALFCAFFYYFTEFGNLLYKYNVLARRCLP